MKLEPVSSKPIVPVPHAEVISRIWQAIAFVEEIRGDMERSLRQSTGRDTGAEAIGAALVALVAAAAALAPATTRPAGVPQREEGS